MRVIVLALGWSVLLSFGLMAAEESDAPLWTDAGLAAKEYPDFRFQAEYLGKKGDEMVGVQVACHEGRTFLVTTYPGGLPGAGNDGRTFDIDFTAP